MSGQLIRGAGAGLLAVLLPAAADAAVLKVRQLNTGADPRARPGEDGRDPARRHAWRSTVPPPSSSDGYENERGWPGDLAETIGGRPGWTGARLPSDPAGDRQRRRDRRALSSSPGSYTVRSATVRAIFMDLATELGEQGFRWVLRSWPRFSASQPRLDDASDFFRDTYRAQMVHLLGLEIDWSEVGRARASLVPPEIRAEDANSVHAGLSETSRVLHVRPDLVARDLKALPSISAPPPTIVETARAPRWPGHSEPRGTRRRRSARWTTRRREGCGSQWPSGSWTGRTSAR